MKNSLLHLYALSLLLLSAPILLANEPHKGNGARTGPIVRPKIPSDSPPMHRVLASYLEQLGMVRSPLLNTVFNIPLESEAQDRKETKRAVASEKYEVTMPTPWK